VQTFEKLSVENSIIVIGGRGEFGLYLGDANTTLYLKPLYHSAESLTLL
jgi:hypothetical protein